MVNYRIKILKQAKSDKEKIKNNPSLKNKVDNLLKVLEENPYKSPPSYEKLVGNYKGLYSRRINIKHRLVYSVDEENKVVKIISMWTYYENL